MEFCILCDAGFEPEDRQNDLCQIVCDDCAAFTDECDEYDGQPDEMQEWHDFDPDC